MADRVKDECCDRRRELLLECLGSEADPSPLFELLIDPITSTQPVPVPKPVDPNDRTKRDTAR